MAFTTALVSTSVLLLLLLSIGSSNSGGGVAAAPFILVGETLTDRPERIWNNDQELGPEVRIQGCTFVGDAQVYFGGKFVPNTVVTITGNTFRGDASDWNGIFLGLEDWDESDGRRGLISMNISDNDFGGTASLQIRPQGSLGPSTGLVRNATSTAGGAVIPTRPNEDLYGHPVTRRLTSPDRLTITVDSNRFIGDNKRDGIFFGANFRHTDLFVTRNVYRNHPEPSAFNGATALRVRTELVSENFYLYIAHNDIDVEALPNANGCGRWVRALGVELSMQTNPDVSRYAALVMTNNTIRSRISDRSACATEDPQFAVTGAQGMDVIKIDTLQYVEFSDLRVDIEMLHHVKGSAIGIDIDPGQYDCLKMRQLVIRDVDFTVNAATEPVAFRMWRVCGRQHAATTPLSSAIMPHVTRDTYATPEKAIEYFGGMTSWQEAASDKQLWTTAHPFFNGSWVVMRRVNFTLNSLSAGAKGTDMATFVNAALIMTDVHSKVNSVSNCRGWIAALDLPRSFEASLTILRHFTANVTVVGGDSSIPLCKGRTPGDIASVEVTEMHLRSHHGAVMVQDGTAVATGPVTDFALFKIRKTMGESITFRNIKATIDSDTSTSAVAFNTADSYDNYNEGQGGSEPFTLRHPLFVTLENLNFSVVAPVPRVMDFWYGSTNASTLARNIDIAATSIRRRYDYACNQYVAGWMDRAGLDGRVASLTIEDVRVRVDASDMSGCNAENSERGRTVGMNLAAIRDSTTVLRVRRVDLVVVAQLSTVDGLIADDMGCNATIEHVRIRTDVQTGGSVNFGIYGVGVYQTLAHVLVRHIDIAGEIGRLSGTPPNATAPYDNARGITIGTVSNVLEGSTFTIENVNVELVTRTYECGGYSRGIWLNGFNGPVAVALRGIKLGVIVLPSVVKCWQTRDTPSAIGIDSYSGHHNRRYVIENVALAIAAPWSAVGMTVNYVDRIANVRGFAASAMTWCSSRVTFVNVITERNCTIDIDANAKTTPSLTFAHEVLRDSVRKYQKGYITALGSADTRAFYVVRPTGEHWKNHDMDFAVIFSFRELGTGRQGEVVEKHVPGTGLYVDGMYFHDVCTVPATAGYGADTTGVIIWTRRVDIALHTPNRIYVRGSRIADVVGVPSFADHASVVITCATVNVSHPLFTRARGGLLVLDDAPGSASRFVNVTNVRVFYSGNSYYDAYDQAVIKVTRRVQNLNMVIDGCTFVVHPIISGHGILLGSELTDSRVLIRNTRIEIHPTIANATFLCHDTVRRSQHIRGIELPTSFALRTQMRMADVSIFINASKWYHCGDAAYSDIVGLHVRANVNDPYDTADCSAMATSWQRVIAAGSEGVFSNFPKLTFGGERKPPCSYVDISRTSVDVIAVASQTHALRLDYLRRSVITFDDVDLGVENNFTDARVYSSVIAFEIGPGGARTMPNNALIFRRLRLNVASNTTPAAERARPHRVPNPISVGCTNFRGPFVGADVVFRDVLIDGCYYAGSTDTPRDVFDTTTGNLVRPYYNRQPGMDRFFPWQEEPIEGSAGNGAGGATPLPGFGVRVRCIKDITMDKAAGVVIDPATSLADGATMAACDDCTASLDCRQLAHGPNAAGRVNALPRTDNLHPASGFCQCSVASADDDADATAATTAEVPFANPPVGDAGGPTFFFPWSPPVDCPMQASTSTRTLSIMPPTKTVTVSAGTPSRAATLTFDPPPTRTRQQTPTGGFPPVPSRTQSRLMTVTAARVPTRTLRPGESTPTIVVPTPAPPPPPPATPTRPLSVTVSLVPPTPVPPPPTTPAPPPPPTLKSAANRTKSVSAALEATGLDATAAEAVAGGSTAAVVASSAANPSAASKGANLANIVAITDCAFGEDSLEPSTMEVVIPLAIGDAPTKRLYGGLLTTTGFTGMFYGIDILLSTADAPRKFRRIMAIVSGAVACYMMPSASTFAMTLMRHGTSTTDTVVGLVGMAAIGLIIVAPAYIIHKQLNTVMKPGEKMVSATDFGRQWFFPFLVLAEGCIDTTSAIRRHMFTEDLLVAVSIGAISGYQPEESQCSTIGYLILVVAMLHLGYSVFIRPFDSAVDSFFMIAIAVGQVLACICAIVAVSRPGMMTLVGYISVIQSVLFAAQSVAIGVVGCITSMRKKRRKKLEMREKRLARVKEVERMLEEHQAKAQHEADQRSRLIPWSGEAGGPPTDQAAATLLAIMAAQSSGGRGHQGGGAYNPFDSPENRRRTAEAMADMSTRELQSTSHRDRAAQLEAMRTLSNTQAATAGGMAVNGPLQLPTRQQHQQHQPLLDHAALMAALDSGGRRSGSSIASSSADRSTDPLSAPLLTVETLGSPTSGQAARPPANPLHDYL